MSKELDELLEALGDLDIDAEEIIKDAAMCRRHVKLSRRPHVRAVLDEAFDMIRERASRKAAASREENRSNGPSSKSSYASDLGRGIT